MGQTFSKFDSEAIDGLGYHAIGGPRPTTQSLEKLKQLLRSIVNYEPDTLAPVLVSLYYLGMTPSQLTIAYDDLAQTLKTWPDENPIADSIGDESLSDFFGLPEYRCRYFEFFRDQLTEYTNWHDILHEYVPILGTKLLGSSAAPLNQLAVAVEIDDPVLAMHALAYAAASDQPFNETGSLEVDLHQLVDMCIDAGAISSLVSAQSFCELMLSGKCIAKDFESIMYAFAQSIKEIATKHQMEPRELSKEYAQFEENPIIAPRLRSQIFAQEFNQRKLFI